MGLFTRAGKRSKPFRIELGWRGLFGVIVVCFCLFFWMFLLGLWAGHTLLLPPTSLEKTVRTPAPSSPERTVCPSELPERSAHGQ
ncbi:MAG: hypothetical protein ACOX5Z_11300 [Desulfobulbus sp.]